MKVSVITVCRNAEKYIERAIKSAISQTYKDIEYIVVDGDSQDNTKEIIGQYATFVDQYISEPDGGVYEAMNKAIRMASGTFLFFLNSDDYFFDETVVQDIVSFVTEHPDCDFVYGDLLFSVEGGFEQLVTFPEPDGLADHLVCNCLLHQASFARKDLFSRIGYFSETYKIGSDYEWFVKLVEDQSLKLYYYPRPIAGYNARGMSSNMTETLAEMFEIQNKAALYQSEFWLQQRILKYQEIIQDPRGRFGLHRTPPDSQAAELKEQLQQLKLRVKRIKEKEQQLKQRLQEAEDTITAMETSKFWKLRQRWFALKKVLRLSPKS